METPTDKSRELVASVKLVNTRLRFEGTAGCNQPVIIDYISPLGDNSGYTSLELFLLSLTSCIGSAVLTFLRKMNRTIEGCRINARGVRKEVHPTGFSKVYISLEIESADVTDIDMQKVIRLSEETYCPVWSMIKGNVETELTFNIFRN